MKNQFKITCTHNPQDFFNGEELEELTKSYITDDLELSAREELKNGYQVIVSEVCKIEY